MNLYVNTEEAKTFLGITGTSKDAKIAMFNKQATDLVNGMIGGDFALHKVTDEIHDAIGQKIQLYDSPLVEIGTIMDDENEYTQDDPIDFDDDTMYLSGYLLGGKRKLKVTYVAGYNASGYSIITVDDYANIAGAATITLGAVSGDGFTITRGVGWTAGTSNETEASKIAAALNAKDNIRAFSIGARVYVIEDTKPQVNSRTIATSDSTRLALSSDTLSGTDFPEAIRAAVMLLIGDLLNRGKNAQIKSYTIGSKQVTFADESKAAMFKNYLWPYIGSRVSVKSI